MMSDRIARLTEQQRVCLRMVYDHMTSKEIAPRLGIEPNSVDQHIKAAMRTLGVSDRRTAARMLAEYENRVAAIELREVQAPFDALPPSATRLRLPIPVRGTRPSDLSVLLRLSWIIGLLFAITLVVGIFLAGLEALSRIGPSW